MGVFLRGQKRVDFSIFFVHFWGQNWVDFGVDFGVKNEGRFWVDFGVDFGDILASFLVGSSGGPKKRVKNRGFLGR
jgi:hypothetical protein